MTSSRLFGIRARLLGLLLIVLLPAIALLAYANLELRRRAEERIRAEALQSAVDAALRHEELFENVRQLLVAFAQYPEFQGDDPVPCQARLESLLKQYPHFINLAAIRTDGYPFSIAAPERFPAYIGDRPHFRRALESKDFAVGGFHPGIHPERPVFAFNYPVLDKAGGVRYILSAPVMKERIAAISGADSLPEGGAMLVVDRNGTVLSRFPNPERWMGMSVTDAPMLRSIAEVKGRGTAEIPGVDNITRLYGFAPLRAQGQSDLHIGVGVPMAEAFSVANRAFGWTVAVFALTIALAVAGAWGFGERYISRGVGALTTAAERIAGGNLQARIGPLQGGGELGHLAERFDEMAASIERSAELLREREERLRESTRRINLILEGISDAFVALDKNWRYTYMNEKAGRIFDRNPRDMIGRHIWTEFPEGIGQPFHLAYERAAREQVPLVIEENYQPYNRWFQNHIYPTADGLSIFFHDFTERKRAESMAAGEKHVLELTATGAPLEKILDTVARNIEALSPGMRCSILLLDEDGLHLRHGAAPTLPEEFARAIDGETIGPVAGSCGTAAYSGVPVIVEDIEADPLWADYRHLALPHGLRACWSTPIKASDGRVLGTFAMYYGDPRLPTPEDTDLIRRVTHLIGIAIERRRTEEALSRSETLLNEAQRISRVGGWEYNSATGRIVWTDETYRIHDLSPGAYDPNDIARDIEFYPPPGRQAIERAFHDAVHLGKPYDLDLQFVSARGRHLWVRTAGKPVSQDGKVIKVIGNIMDITERKQAEEEIRKLNEELEGRVIERTAQLEAANREMEAFSYSVSHDLRAPLRGMDGFGLALLEDYADRLDERGKDYLGRIRSATQRMGALIDDMLTLSKVTRGDLVRERLDLSAMALSIVADLRERYPGREVEVVVEKGLSADADRRLMRVALQNLLDNAWKFTGKATQARVEFGAEEGPEGLAFYVRDNGAGFDMAYADKLFGAFQRLHTLSEFPGTGVGLATVQRIVLRHGGKVRAEGVVGRGATFRFTL